MFYVFRFPKGIFLKSPFGAVWARVSLRLGHARVLPPHCGGIHCARAASLPTTFALPYGVFLFAKGAVSAPCHPERSKAESNFFLRDSKRYYAAFDPRYARISTTLRMTRRKKRRALRDGIYFCASRTKRKSGVELLLLYWANTALGKFPYAFAIPFVLVRVTGLGLADSPPSFVKNLKRELKTSN